MSLSSLHGRSDKVSISFCITQPKPVSFNRTLRALFAKHHQSLGCNLVVCSSYSLPPRLNLTHPQESLNLFYDRKVRLLTEMGLETILSSYVRDCELLSGAAKCGVDCMAVGAC